MSGPKHFIEVEVVLARTPNPWLTTITIPPGSTVQDALLAANVYELFPELKWDQLTVGVYGKAVAAHYLLKHNDRLEVYWPLQVDPKQRRALLARKTTTDRSVPAGSRKK